MIRDIFRDPYKEVTTTTLAKLAAALGVPVSDLFEEVADDRAGFFSPELLMHVQNTPNAQRATFNFVLALQ